MLNKASIYKESDWNIGEFFIIARFQRNKVGEIVFTKLISDYPGNWEISVIPENKPALAFGKSCLENFVDISYTKEIVKVDFDESQPKRILFRCSLNHI